MNNKKSSGLTVNAVIPIMTMKQLVVYLVRDHQLEEYDVQSAFRYLHKRISEELQDAA